MKITNADAERALKEVAARNHTTVEEVRKQIKLAMLAALCNPDPSVQEKWKGIPCAGEVPTPEELIAYLTNTITSEDSRKY